MTRFALAAASLALATVALAQTPQHGGAPTPHQGHGASPAEAATPQVMGAQGLPEQCRVAAGDMAHARMGGVGQGSMGSASMPMTDAQKAYMEAMDRMHGPMMVGVHAKDPDVAFICGMLPHHQGAIDMARVVLKYGSDPEAKRLAESVIKDQGREIEQMAAWLKRNVR